MTARILIVDDSLEERRFMASQLEGGGAYSVETAASGEEALRRLARGGIDLLVTDLVMPGLDGLQLSHMAVEVDPALSGRVLLVTGSMYGRIDVLAFAAGIEVLTKPLAEGQLVSKIEDLLSRTSPFETVH